MPEPTADKPQAEFDHLPRPRCPKCKGHRVGYYEAVTTTVCWDNVVLVNGVVIPLDQGIDDASQPLSIKGRLACDDCDHDWPCRYRFDPLVRLTDLPLPPASSTPEEA